MPGLTDKQRLFVAEYLVDLNATQAAIRAGYSRKTAYATGAENLRKPQIAAEIEKALQARIERTNVSADKVVKEYARLAFTDMRSFVEWDDDGLHIKASEELSEDDSPAVTHVKFTPGQYGETIEVKLGHKDSALRALAEHTGVLGRQAGINVNVSVDARRVEDRETHFERLFSQLDAYRAGFDGDDGEGDRGVRLDSGSADDTPASIPKPSA